jgi:hypothetical protein
MDTETKHFITQHNAITGETVVREMTDEEYAEYEASFNNVDNGISAE